MLPVMRSLPESAVFDIVESPVGNLWCIAAEDSLRAILWDEDLKDPDCKRVLKKLERVSSHPVLAKTRSQLDEYFEGRRKSFNIKLEMIGTDFQKKTWKQLTKIPYGKTLSYGEQASAMGEAGKARAVGAANGRNPISIVVPCHRVIGKDGKMQGFAAGTEVKRKLLDLEKYATSE